MRLVILPFAAAFAMGCSGDGDSGGRDSGGLQACPSRSHGYVRVLLANDAHDFDWSSTGVVTHSGDRAFTVDTCVPGSGCTPDETTVAVEGGGPDFHLQIPMGAYVAVEARAIQSGYGGVDTSYTLSVRNVPSWAGPPNPSSSTESWYVLLADGEPVPGAPFEVTGTRLECDGEQTYDFAFQEPGGASVSIPTDSVLRFELAAQSWIATIVRSSRPVCCDYPSAYAWWATLAPNGSSSD